jgi:glycosyltransferase involved in cell wall biosynthesis
MSPSPTHLVLIPSYNSGPRLASTVLEALGHWSPVWVVVDGSTDGSADKVSAWAADDARLRVIAREKNGGKGAAVATGVDEALKAGFTHVLTMDSDGQHSADHIEEFMRASASRPEALVLGRPTFGPEAPPARIHGRKLSVALARLEILGSGIDDPLFGFRVYPASAFQSAFASTRHARRFDFDHEIAVRMFWAGTPTLNLAAPCQYLPKSEGGVSHFNYLRDNMILIWLNVRLISQLILGKWLTVRRLRRAMMLALVLAVRCAAADGPPPVSTAGLIADPARDPAWTDLFSRLSPNRNREAGFEERRYFPFRKTPVVLTGELRMAAGRGLSLAYLTPTPRTVIVDDQGLLIRSPDGRDIAAPNGDRFREFADVLVEIIRFDLPRVARDFELRGDRQGPAWTLTLSPRSPALAAQFQTIVIAGAASRLSRIDLIRSAKERIEVLIGQTSDGVVFPAETLARYFR